MKRRMLGVVCFTFFVMVTAVHGVSADSLSGKSNRPIKTIKTDVLVIGGGGAGLAAAAAAKDALRDGGSVLIVEKRSVTGGNSVNITSPITVPGTSFAPGPVMQGTGGRSPASDPQAYADDQYRKMIDWTHWRLDAPLVRALILKARETSDWMWGLLSEEEQQKMIEARAPGTTRQDPRSGEPYSIVMTRICINLGVEILTDTAATKILTDRSGAVAGALAEGKNEDLAIEAPCVVIATGGFIGNLELMKKFYFPAEDNIYDEIYIKGIKHTGDGIKMAAEVGASMDAAVAFETTFEPLPWAVSDVNALRSFANSRNGALVWLDGKGRRFANESETDALNARRGLFRHTFYIVFDENIKDNIIDKKNTGMGGPPGGGTPGGAGMPMMSGGQSYDSFDEEFEKQVAQGHAVKADSLDELAGWIGCEPDVLQKTVREYNEGCEKGYDSLILKDAEYLVPLNRGPYYAIKNLLAIHLTHGPIRVTPRMEVVDKNHDPIPGLFAAGNDIGGTDVDTYAGVVSRHSSGWAFAGGRIAGESAAAYVTSEK